MSRNVILPPGERQAAPAARRADALPLAIAREWVVSMAGNQAAKDRPDDTAVRTMAKMLLLEFPDGSVFNDRALHHALSTFGWWPSFKDLAAALHAWRNEHRQTAPAIADNSLDGLSAADRSMCIAHRRRRARAESVEVLEQHLARMHPDALERLRELGEAAAPPPEPHVSTEHVTALVRGLREGPRPVIVAREPARTVEEQLAFLATEGATAHARDAPDQGVAAPIDGENRRMRRD